jgi:hypothetical protein
MSVVTSGAIAENQFVAERVLNVNSLVPRGISCGTPGLAYLYRLPNGSPADVQQTDVQRGTR